MDLLTRVLTLLIDGIAQGAVLALLGIGITIVFGLGGVLNLAIGVFAVIAVVGAIAILGAVPVAPIAILGGIVLAGVVGLAIDKSALSLVYKSEGEERILLGIFVTLGIAIFLDGVLVNYYPSSYSLSSGIPSMTVLGVQIRGSSIAVLAITIVIFAILYYFFSRTYLGAATRTVMQDETGAILCGISPRRMRTFVFVLSAVIAGIAGILYSFSATVAVADGFELTILALIVSIIGGVTSIVGAVAAGITIGIIVTFTSAYVGAYIAEVVLFVIAILVLVARPEEVA